MGKELIPKEGTKLGPKFNFSPSALSKGLAEKLGLSPSGVLGPGDPGYIAPDADEDSYWFGDRFGADPDKPDLGWSTEIGGPLGKEPPPGETVLKTDAWGHAQGRRLHQHLEEKDAKHSISPAGYADFFDSAFQHAPELAEPPCEDKRRTEFVQTMLESPEYEALHHHTEGDVMASDMAAAQFAKRYRTLMVNDENRQKKFDKAAKDGDPVDQDEQDMRNEIACIKAVGRALKAAQQEVQDMEDLMGGLGRGPGSGIPLPPEKIGKLFNRVRNNRQLHDIFNKAGRFRLSAQAAQRQKVKHGYDDMIGVELGGDVARLIPSELAMLGHPMLKMDAIRRLAERQMLCRQYRGYEKVNKGPVIVCIDESGSMAGPKIETAKAFALAMMWIAQKQKRWCFFVSFGDESEKGEILGIGPQHTIDDNLILDWLTHFYGGGTSLRVPLTQAIDKKYVLDLPMGKADMIIITDAQVDVPPQYERVFLDWKKQHKSRCIGIVLESGAGEMHKVCDEVHLVKQLEVGSDAVQSAFSI